MTEQKKLTRKDLRVGKEWLDKLSKHLENTRWKKLANSLMEAHNLLCQEQVEWTFDDDEPKTKEIKEPKAK